MRKQNDLKLITTFCMIGKSKSQVLLIFSANDFRRIEDGKLYLYSDEREFKLSDEQITGILNQFNQE